jgi:penicillin-binding protein 1C
MCDIRGTALNATLCGLATLVVAAATTWICCLPFPADLVRPIDGTATLLDCKGRQIAEISSENARMQNPIELSEMGEWLPRATVAIEDHRFFEHGPIDLYSTAAALFRNLQAGRIVSGGSTITQQLVKMSIGRRERNWIAKLYETIVAWKLECCWSKERILAEYLNRCQYGNRRAGPEAAARTYFGKSARELNLAEAVFLSGLPQAPTRFNPWKHPEAAAKKYRLSLDQLVRENLISPDQLTILESAVPTVFRLPPPHLAPHFVDAVMARNPHLYGIVHTTLDLDLQRAAERLVNAHLDALNRNDITDAAVVVIDNATGGVRAMVGSQNYAINQVNGAVRMRSCGSTLKPFIYLAAIDKRLITAATVLPDTPDAARAAYADYDPRNFNNRYLGPVRVREALACSLNVPAIVALSRLGARAGFFELEKWGIHFRREFDNYGAGFILGNAEIRLVDLAGAYAGLARNGLAMDAKFLATEHHSLSRVASVAATQIVNDILCDNDAREQSFGVHSPLALEERVAAKTGTSSGYRDAWTVGFDKERTVAVWAGNSNGGPMRETIAVRAAAPLWAGMMRLLLQHDHPLDPVPESDFIDRCNVCSVSGLLPSRFSVATRSEYFLKGTEPVRDSENWFSTDGNLLLPSEYAEWCAGSSNGLGATVQTELRVTSPLANAHYEIDPILPAPQQMVELRATLPGVLRWLVNGEPQHPNSDGRVFWPLQPGQWVVRAVHETGEAEARFTVE